MFMPAPQQDWVVSKTGEDGRGERFILLMKDLRSSVDVPRVRIPAEGDFSEAAARDALAVQTTFEGYAVDCLFAVARLTFGRQSRV
jgi:hypothetical protein